MTFLDRWLQQQRIKTAIPFIPDPAILLDIGCHKGELFGKLGEKIQKGFGIDPLLNTNSRSDRYQLIRGNFPDDYHFNEPLNCITLLAVLEHIPVENQKALAQRCASLLVPGGRVIITVPAIKTDRLLSVLKNLRLIRGMSLEEHHGFEPAFTITLFESAGLNLLRHQVFQLGFNNLFVFEKKV